jgi:arylsulfatase A-like enzyme
MVRGQGWPGGSVSVSNLVVLGTSFGLLAGFVEGLALRFLQNGPLAGATINSFLVSQGILYVAPIADAVFFTGLAFLLAAICYWCGRRSPERPVIFLLIFLLLFDWLSLALDRVMDPAVIVILSAGISAALERGLRGRTTSIVRAARASLPALATAVAALMIVLPAERRYAARAEAAALPPAQQDSPNVLIVVMDTVRADHLSALGYQRPTSPRLERLAARGVLFENAFSTSSWTLPAHASLLTGRFPFEHGAELLDYDGRFPTLPEAFQARGYRTGAFSGNTFYFTRENGFGRGFLRFDGVATTAGDVLSRPFYGRQLVTALEEATHFDLPGRKRSDEINRDFLDWVQQDSGRPFFAVLNYFDAHAPYLPPNPFRSRFSVRPDPGGILNFVGDRESLESAEDQRDETDAYDGAIAFEDAQLGDLLESLRQRGKDTNTLTIILSDHGEFLGEHQLYLHRNALFLESIRVPVVVLWPGHLPSGTRVSVPVSIADLPATITQLLPHFSQARFPGSSLAPLWNANPASPESFPILAELVSRRPDPSGRPHPRTESLLTAQWHFLRTDGQRAQLFDWRADPRELRDVADSPEGQAVASRLESCVNERRAHIREPNCGSPAGKNSSVVASASPAQVAP